MNDQTVTKKRMSPSDIKSMAPGIYFGLDEDTYHADPSLGSTALKDLATNPSDYWWGSWMNPMREERDSDTPALVRGKAVHSLVLYGEDAFAKSYIRGAVHSAGMTPAEKGAATKAANAKAIALGKTALPAKTYDSVAIASAMIAKNPSLANALVGGMNEVSIFWRDPKTGIPFKARIDCLKARGVGDLKSIANKFDKPFPKACQDNITNYHYHVQAAHYLHARALIPRLVNDGRVFGDHDKDLLARIVKTKEYAWQWVFWQAEGAPVTWSAILSPQNPILELGRIRVEMAVANYVDYLFRFGTDDIWLLQEEPAELAIEDLPPWFSR